MAGLKEEKKASHGERMIEVKVRFWTDAIAGQKGYVRPKHAWTGGMVTIESNNAHSIIPLRARPFFSLMEIPGVVEKVLIEHGIQLHLYRQMDKYIRRD